MPSLLVQTGDLLAGGMGVVFRAEGPARERVVDLIEEIKTQTCCSPTGEPDGFFLKENAQAVAARTGKNSQAFFVDGARAQPRTSYRYLYISYSIQKISLSNRHVMAVFGCLACRGCDIVHA